ncbi:MAG: peptidylprolyl isomerase [Pseudomonadota bacterium]
MRVLLLCLASLCCAALAAETRVVLETNRGAITLAIDEASAPRTSANFVEYVKAGHYDGAQFHRVIAGFMIQGGGFDAEFNRLPTREPIENEADNGLQNARYTVAMARTNDPHSATAQFFINVADNDFLDHTAKTARGWGYAVFGTVVGGSDVVDAIAGVDTGPAGPFGRDVPRELVIIERAAVVTDQ